MKKIILIIIVFILILNLTPVSYLLKESYTYTNIDGSFKFQEEGGGINFQVTKKRFQRFLKKNPDKAVKDSRLYRTFKIKPWYIWQWGDYIFQNERFRLPYKDPATIK